MSIIAARGKARIMSVIFLIRKMNPEIDVVWIPLNLLDNGSVRAAADAIKQLKTDKIHFVINNAGAIAVRGYTTSKQGIESQFATNYLGHFLLTNLLMDRILATREEGAIIINVGSLGYELGEANLDDINFEEGKPYNPWKGFRQSKTAMLLWNTALGQRMANKGVPTLVRNDGKPLRPQNMVTRQEAAGAVILVALNPRFRGSFPAFIVDQKIYTETKSYAISEEGAEKLWKLSKELVGERFEF
ncbi:7f560997-8c61-4610-b648-65a9b0723b92 [Sclerotinia trifoliorum]|uniref:7f560997-8c61-4610-b648-65a9b0723b92 n=1 Tax=Sclerotinia trifoliorum TaxID=28548 RepID=A0A8H2VNV1_9HELO|nr:7f560997-8c61-4610-b648-65a9b0723b92 [Sclerotinia trifoliorum]